MKKRTRKANRKTNKPPVTLLHHGAVLQENYVLDTFQYTIDQCQRHTIVPPFEATAKENFWINIEGLGTIDKVAELAKLADAHKLQVEDILNFNHRPKADIINDTLLFIFKRFDINEHMELDTEQISILLKGNILISFQERSGDSFNHLREALTDKESFIRKHPVNYLFYRMIDSITDSYFEITDHLEDQLAELEDRIIADDPQVDLSDIVQIKKTTYQVRKHVRPLREANMDLKKVDFLTDKTMEVFFNDINDHLTHILEQCDGIIDSATNLISIYHSNSGNRLNEIMKRLTIVSTIFIPLSFLAGLYGMNFKNIPELNTEYGYPILIGAMLVIAISIYIYMKRSRWF